MRSLWKIKYIKSSFYKTKRKKNTTIYTRDSIIVAPWVGRNMLIHTGNSFKRILIESKHLGYKVGEFAFTRKYTKKINKKKDKNKKGA